MVGVCPKDPDEGAQPRRITKETAHENGGVKRYVNDVREKRVKFHISLCQ